MTTQQTYTDLVIVGNGFDLNLGLKTSYRDFIESKEFDAQTGSSLALFLKEKQDIELWVDAELELIEYSKFVSDKHHYNVKFEDEYYLLCQSLMSYLKTIRYDSLNQNSWAFDLIRTVKNSKFAVVDFNYTRTIENVLLMLGIERSQFSGRHFKMHGSIENNIIFGIDDKSSFSEEHIFLTKSFQDHYRPIHLLKLITGCEKIHLFGHSLGETDHMYFSTLFSLLSNDNRKSRDVNMYYHGKQSYTSLLKQINKLTYKQTAQLRQFNNFIPINTASPYT